MFFIHLNINNPWEQTELIWWGNFIRNVQPEMKWLLDIVCLIKKQKTWNVSHDDV